MGYPHTLHNHTHIIHTGMDKVVRVYDLAQPDAPPQKSGETIDKLRCVVFCQDDNLLLVSYIDKPNLEYVVLFGVVVVVYTLPVYRIVHVEGGVNVSTPCEES